MRRCLYCKAILVKKETEIPYAWKRRIFCDIKCRQHMSHYKTHGNPSTRTSKVCPSCKKNKLLIYFPNNKKRTDGRGSYCSSCKSIQSRLRKTGWSNDEYKNKYIQQKGKCEINGCGQKIEAADHNHDTGKIRGLLCRRHNVILYYFDNKNEYKSIVEYLNKYEKLAEERKK